MTMVASQTPHPIGSYLAPAVRVRALSDALRSGPEAGAELDGFAEADILRAEVTLVNTGCSQFSITLNNWHASTPRDRHDGKVARESGSPARPLWPRYKYNNLDILKFGQRLRIDMRYWPDHARDLNEVGRRSHAWTPMVSGPITDMKFSFGKGAEVTVSGEDDLSRLKDKPGDRKDFSKPSRSDRQIVEEILRLAKYPLNALAAPLVRWPGFAEQAGSGVAEAIGDNQSYFEYLDKLAQKLDFEVFVAFASLDAPEPALAFHFEPARSRAGPTGDVFILERDRHLIDYTPTIKVADQPSKVMVRGRHRDRGRPERVEQAIDLGEMKGVLGDELFDEPAEGFVMHTGPEVRDRFFPGRDNVQNAPNQTNTDSERAEELARAMLRAKAREFFTIEATTIGLPRLRPGGYIQIRGMRPPFDGFFYVTRTVHTFGPEGLRTRLSARRPGMPLPPKGGAS